MKLYQNVISNTLREKCVDEIRNNSQKKVWESSSLIWNRNIRNNISGSCIICEVSEVLTAELSNSIIKYLPKHEKIAFQFCIWQADAGVSLHDDGEYRFGATIYLNKHWNIDWGGIFLWYDTKQDFHSGNVKGFVPRDKTMILNDEKQLHLVTPVSASSPDFRMTIQIRGK